MAESIKPFGEDSSTLMEDLADFAGDVAKEIYKTELEKGSQPSQAVTSAIEGATGVMMDSGCPREICDSLALAAINGFTAYMESNPNCDPMEAFEAAGECVNEALESDSRNTNNESSSATKS